MHTASRRKLSIKHSLLFTGSLMFLMGMTGCVWGLLDRTLNVVIEEGVTGTPLEGAHTYKEHTPIEYNYSPKDSQYTVEVLVNNGAIRSSGKGKLTLWGDNYELRAKLVDIRGKWKVTLTYSDTEIEAIECTLTLTGPDLLSGDFSDSRGYNGTWQAEGSLLVLSYSDWSDYALNGNPFSMSGTFVGGGLDGTWKSVREE